MTEGNTDLSTDNDNDYNNEFRVDQEIIKEEAIVVYDTAVKGNYIVEYW